MPSYSYKCPFCETPFSRRLPISQHSDPQSCPQCGSTAMQVVSEGVSGVLRGDAWPGKAQTLRKQMSDRRARVGRREEQWKREGAPGGKLVPNVGGELVDSWAEATKLAKSQGADTAGYEQRARKEKDA